MKTKTKKRDQDRKGADQSQDARPPVSTMNRTGFPKGNLKAIVERLHRCSLCTVQTPTGVPGCPRSGCDRENPKRSGSGSKGNTPLWETWPERCALSRYGEPRPELLDGIAIPDGIRLQEGPVASATDRAKMERPALDAQTSCERCREGVVLLCPIGSRLKVSIERVEAQDGKTKG